MMNVTTLQNFVTNELTSELQEVIFTTDLSGKYYLFQKYVIVKSKTTYKVYSLKPNFKIEFISLKNATAWCILDNAGKYKDARRIQSLDLKLSSIDVDIAVHKNKIKNSKDNYNTLISITKLQQDTFKRRLIVSELNNYINNSKRIQDSNFAAKGSKIKYRR
jgi:hypothetical protein